MPLRSIAVFGGMAPLMNPRKLPDAGATVAQWTKFEGTDLRAWRDPATVEYDPGQGSDMPLVGGYTRLFRFTVYSNGAFQARRWLAWSGLPAIHPVASPIPADQFARLYWTDQGRPMRVASSPTLSMVLGTTPGTRDVGIPAPTERPTGSPIDDSALNSARPIAITKAAPAVVTLETPPDQPFRDGQQVQVIITTAEDAPQQNMRELSGKQFLVSDPSSTQITLRGSDTTTYSDFVDPSAAIISAVYTDADYDDRVYVFTLVSDWGEEGPPSPPSDIITARKDGGKVTVTLKWARPNGYDHITTMRVYRTLTGEDGTRFFFVKDIPFSGGSPSVPAIVEFEDDVDPIKIGELMPSTEWTAPVSGMFGLLGMPNGFFIAGKGNTLYACEAYQPHAWPDRYRKTLETEFVGAAAMGQAAVIATSSKPYLAVGSDPASLTVQILDGIDAPCLNARSIVSTGTAVVYATHDGLAYISPSGSRIITQNIFTKQQWSELWGALSSAGFHDGRYVVFSTSGSFPTFALRIDPDGELQYTQFPGMLASACALDTANDSLHFVGQDGGGDFRRLFRFDAGLTLHTYTWTSKVFTEAAPVSYAVAQVFAKNYPVTLQVLATRPVAGNPNPPLAVVHAQTVSSAEPFRLPSGFTAREWQITLSGTAEVQRIDMATSMLEMRSA